MKFGKRLQIQLDESLPEWKDKYLSYKRLKKRLKLISAPEEEDEDDDESFTLKPCEEDNHSHGSSASEAESLHENNEDDDAKRKSSTASDAGTLPQALCEGTHMGNLTAEEADFIHLLNDELEKFNTFFVEKEEEYVIRLQALKERIEQLKEKSCSNETTATESNLNEEMIKIQKDFVNFHGEMVLLENYSSLNYTGLGKILKKHDKRTGLLLRMPFIQNVLHQPFFTTELLSKLVHECESTLQSLFPSASTEDAMPTISAPAITEKALNGVNSMAQMDMACKVQEELPSERNAPQLEGQEDSFFYGDEVENIYKSTMAALKTMKELRKGSSTYNVFSLPPYGQGNINELSPIGDGSSPSSLYATIPICPKD